MFKIINKWCTLHQFCRAYFVFINLYSLCQKRFWQLHNMIFITFQKVHTILLCFPFHMEFNSQESGCRPAKDIDCIYNIQIVKFVHLKRFWGYYIRSIRIKIAIYIFHLPRYISLYSSFKWRWPLDFSSYSVWLNYTCWL